jgi:hypothetical protein
MSTEIYRSLRECFGTLEDPRSEINRAHLLMDMVVISICAVICGADDWEAVAEYGEAKAEWLSTFLALPQGIPAHDTFWRVFRALLSGLGAELGGGAAAGGDCPRRQTTAALA